MARSTLLRRQSASRDASRALCGIGSLITMPARFLRTSSEHLQEAARLAHLARDGDLDDVVRQVCAVMASVHEQMAHALAGAAMSASAPPRCDDRPAQQAASSRRRCHTGAWTLRRAATSL